MVPGTFSLPCNSASLLRNGNSDCQAGASPNVASQVGALSRVELVVQHHFRPVETNGFAGEKQRKPMKAGSMNSTRFVSAPTRAAIRALSFWSLAIALIA